MIDIQNLVKHFVDDRGKVVSAVDNVSIHVGAGEFFTLLGSSGSGKTTLLRCVAGLERPESGSIVFGERTVYSGKKVFVPPQERGLGMVFQSYAIWPHMTVFENVAYPLRVTTSLGRGAVHDAVMEVLALVGLDELSDRPSPALSGGQQQRVALARAVVTRPSILLLDEPLSNLDSQLRSRMRVEIRSLTQRLGITSIYVTHDQTEALTMSDRVAVMHGGRIVQEASPLEIYRSPSDEFVAQFVGATNLISGTVAAVREDGRLVVACGLGQVRCDSRLRRQVGDEVQLVIRPENFTLIFESSQDEKLNYCAGEVVAAQFVGPYIYCRVAVGELELHTNLHSYDEISLGQQVRLGFETCWVSILE